MGGPRGQASVWGRASWAVWRSGCGKRAAGVTPARDREPLSRSGSHRLPLLPSLMTPSSFPSPRASPHPSSPAPLLTPPGTPGAGAHPSLAPLQQPGLPPRDAQWRPPCSRLPGSGMGSPLGLGPVGRRGGRGYRAIITADLRGPRTGGQSTPQLESLLRLTHSPGDEAIFLVFTFSRGRFRT